jgi:N-carbamoyl-L-amino-acid hydrolase
MHRFRIGLLLVAALAFLGASQRQAPFHIDSQRLQQLLEDLSRFGRDPEGGVTRLGFSEADRAAREWVMEKMHQAGLEVRVDRAGNIHGTRAGTDPSLPIIAFGSHIDTVPRGGNFDGTLGSMSALEVLWTLHDEEAVTRHDLEMVIWAFEDSGKGLYGSRAVSRGIDPGELELEDPDGVSLAERLRRCGLDPDKVDSERIDPKRYRAFIELHIEQGPVLFRRRTQIGVVQGIVGVDHFDVTIEGFANHAGTTPMGERRDAMVAAGRLVGAVREEVMAKPGNQVGNVGSVRVLPGAPNVVPGLVKMPIELRDLNREVLDDMMNRIRARAEVIAKEEKVAISIEHSDSAPPALTDPTVQDVTDKAAKEAGFSTLRMPSGAGHDAQIIAESGIPIGMIFVPSKDGISHSPKEWTDWEDCARGAEVLYRTVLELDKR